jgi:hypothetical protein
MAGFSSSVAGLRAAAAEAAASAIHVFKLAEGLAGAVQRARLDGLSEEEIARHLSALASPQVVVRAALAADGDGMALRFLVASLVAEPGETLLREHTMSDRTIRVMGWG